MLILIQFEFSQTITDLGLLDLKKILESNLAKNVHLEISTKMAIQTYLR